MVLFTFIFKFIIYLLSIVLQVIFIPFLLICGILYPEVYGKRRLLLHAYFNSKKDYDEIMKTEGEYDDFFTVGYSEWKDNEQAAKDECEANGQQVLRIRISPTKYLKWVKESNVKNSIDSRELYMKELLDHIIEHGLSDYKQIEAS